MCPTKPPTLPQVPQPHVFLTLPADAALSTWVLGWPPLSPEELPGADQSCVWHHCHQGVTAQVLSMSSARGLLPFLPQWQSWISPWVQRACRKYFHPVHGLACAQVAALGAGGKTSRAGFAFKQSLCTSPWCAASAEKGGDLAVRGMMMN